MSGLRKILEKGTSGFLCLKYIIVVCFFLACINKKCFAQDLHFSQFFSSPLSTNPANTGFIPDADYRLGAQYRSQFSNIMLLPYRTYSAFGDAQVLKNEIENGWIGIGGLLLSDVAGSGVLTSNKFYGSIAYHQMLGNSSLLSAGFNLGWVSKRINVNDLKFPDQFDGHFFDKTLPTSVVLTRTSTQYFDLQAGVNYAYFPNDNVYINAGYSIHHINQAKETFFEETINSRMPIRHIAFVNAMAKVNDNLILSPNVFYSLQQRSYNLVLGTLANINLSDKGEKQLIVGLYHRWRESLIPMFGFEISKVQFIFNYDVTVSDLNQYNSSRGAAEVSIIKKGFYNQPAVRETLCPSF
jgi:type IX secretion system PorP/SprF family membrane protein